MYRDFECDSTFHVLELRTLAVWRSRTRNSDLDSKSPSFACYIFALSTVNGMGKLLLIESENSVGSSSSCHWEHRYRYHDLVWGQQRKRENRVWWECPEQARDSGGVTNVLPFRLQQRPGRSPKGETSVKPLLSLKCSCTKRVLSNRPVGMLTQEMPHENMLPAKCKSAQQKQQKKEKGARYERNRGRQRILEKNTRGRKLRKGRKVGRSTYMESLGIRNCKHAKGDLSKRKRA